MPRRVAIIAVHGVGHHRPHEAARATADLLAGHPNGVYSPFVEAPIRIAVRRVETGVAANAPPKKTAIFEERPDFIRDPVKKREHPNQPELEYMSEQLSSYQVQGEDRVYDTVSLTATRTDAKTGEKTEVHVYDMYWTDLSRVSTTGLRLIGELYQLLFYVCGLGRHTMDFACMSKRDSRLWQALAEIQKNAERLLTLWIPVLNLCALGLGVVVVPQRLYAVKNDWAIWAAASVLIILFILSAAIAKRRFAPGPSWPWVFWVALVVGPVVGLLSFEVREVMPIALALACWAVVGTLIVLLMYAYEGSRRGALWIGVVSVFAVAAMLVCPIVTRHVGASNIEELGLRTGEWLYDVLHALWSAYLVLALSFSLLALVAAKGAPSEDRRSLWTTNISLALPGLLVLTLNLGLWRGILKLSEKFLDAQTTTRIGLILDVSTPWAFVIILGLAGVAFLSVVWALLPSIFGEVFPAIAAKKPAAPMGTGLSVGFRAMRIAGECIRWLLVLAVPVTFALAETFHVVPAWILDAVSPVSVASTFWIGLALIAMIAGPGPLRAMALGLRTAIDVAIDVANWLRLHPLEQNPRARICARFASLLRNILEYKDADGRKFDRIVIFSHSQGTVISAELLRYLHLNNDELSARLAEHDPVLFTMGSPLRQLYSQRFPVQYGWARHSAASWPGPVPDPDELAVTTWANAYRSADYVGRYLWYADGDANAWDGVVRVDDTGKRMERCIGGGAHTHYWDDTAPEVRAMLDGFAAGGR